MPHHLFTRLGAVADGYKYRPKGGKIVDPKAMDFLEEQGKESQRRREEAAEKRRKDDEAKKMTEDAGKDSQQRRGKGFI
ncbi:hypothetical protein FLAG1_08536 [Fusarium langsethiae]|uniref:Uncharacterized protein n=1 Tax=Fusarium langsethiae TaxID=179993 RepID=A0A0M9ERZ7_FUSLA|nr:hypothetical protein FLAG1_08536 [Fusarium langsethiae]